MAKNSRTPRKDTRNIPVVRIGQKIRIRVPFFLPPQLLVLGITICVLAALFPFTTTVQTFDLPKVGEAANETIIAPFTFDVIRSGDDLDKERKKAMDQVLLVLNHEADVRKRVQRKLMDLRTSILHLVDKSIPDSVKTVVHHQLSRELSENTIKNLMRRPYLLDDAISQAANMLDRGVSAVLLVRSPEALSELRAQYNTSFDRHLLYDKQYATLAKDSVETTVNLAEISVKEIALEGVVKRLKEERRFDDEALNTVYELLFAYVKPNVTIDGTATLQRKQKASQEILEISGKVIKDTEIVRKHQEVTPETIQKLRSFRRALDRMENVQEKRKINAGNAGRLLLTLMPLLFLAFYIYNYSPDLMKNVKHLWAFAIILVSQIVIIRLGMVFVPRLFGGSTEMTALTPDYLIPTSMGAILVAILFGLELSVILTFFVSVYFGIVLGFNHYAFIFALLGGLISSFSARNIRYRWHFFKVIPPVFIIYAIIISLWHLIAFKMSVLSLFQNCGLALINVIGATFLTMTMAPLFERFFDITTSMTLVELSDMNHPILKRLSIEAAGTYNHSVLVGNLSESAAERIGANALLARVASYYHDIGKIEKSDYFVENCLALDRNRHNKLTPNMSALIISSHVKEGIELARKHRLPKVIQEIIAQHHGNQTVSFFYEKALELDPHKQVQEQDFRYPGPIPQTREAAIIMLADSVEAASRSLATSSPKLLRELVKKIIRDKFMASQLDQCDLTLRDLDEIIEGFMPVLQGIFHSRIEYPSK